MKTPAAVRLAVVLVVAVLAGCSRQQPATEKVSPAGTSDITATNALVNADQIPHDAQTQIVRADFNADHLEDVAVSTKTRDGQSLVSIYLQTLATNAATQYTKVVDIRQAGDYTVSALMSGGASNHTDLLAIYKYADGRKDLVHFRSSGSSFREIEREHLAIPNHAAGPAHTPAP